MLQSTSALSPKFILVCRWPVQGESVLQDGKLCEILCERVFFCTLWWFDDAVHWRWKVLNLTTKLDWKYSFAKQTLKSCLVYSTYFYITVHYTPCGYIHIKRNVCLPALYLETGTFTCIIHHHILYFRDDFYRKTWGNLKLATRDMGNLFCFYAFSE